MLKFYPLEYKVDSEDIDYESSILRIYKGTNILLQYLLYIDHL